MVNKVVSNTGPILHLIEISLIKALDIFSLVFIPEEVASELRKNKILVTRKIKIIKLRPESKDTVKIFTNQYSLGLGEAEAIALSLQENVNYFLTDDLDAREIAKKYNLEVHGTVGIVLRAFRKKVINRRTAMEKIKELKTKSSLFITQDLINKIMNSIIDFSHKG